MNKPLLVSVFVACMRIPPLLQADALEDRLKEARSLLDAGKRPEAAEKYEALKANLKTRLGKTPDDAHLHYLYGCVCMAGGFDEDAASAFEKAIKLEPKNPDYLTERALLLEYQNKPAEAAKFLQRAAEAVPAKSEAWRNLARVQAASGQHHEAAASLRKAADLGPDDANLLCTVAAELMAADEAAEAEKMLHRAISIDPKHVDSHMNLGQLLQSAGRYAESLAAYRKGLELAPDDFQAHAKEVQLLQALDRPAERDAARERVFALWKAGKADKAHQELYCREQLKHGQSNLLVFEYFELTGERAVRYSFHILGKDHKTEKKISLGSYDVTNLAAHASGFLKGDERVFHLDTYVPGRHETLAMFAKEPSYEETRALVVDYLDGKLKPSSSSTYTEEE